MSDTTNSTAVTSNPATQTLFRFVSLRNPELIKKEGNTKFIFRNDADKDIFDHLIDEWKPELKISKIDFLVSKIKNNPDWFNNRIKKEDALSQYGQAFYDTAKKFVTEKSLVDTEVQMINNTPLDTKIMWNTIIYQVLMQEDFYIKEFLTNVLQMIHYAKNYTSFSTEPIAKKKLAKQKEISTAKVVIPESLFVDSVTVGGQSNAFTVGSSLVGSNDPIGGGGYEGFSTNNSSENNQYYPTESVLKRQKLALATYKRRQMEDLKKEMVKAQSLYNKQYIKAYDLASKNYQALIKPLYDAYEQQLLQVEATFTEEMTEAAKKLALSQVAQPIIPDFEFEFRAERDVPFLQSKLSETSLEAFVGLIGEYANPDTITGRLNNGEVLQENIVEIGEDQFVLPADENQTFEEIIATLNDRLSSLNEEIYQNTEVEKQEYVSVGGVVIPVNKTNNTDLAFTARTIMRAQNYLSIQITFNNQSLEILEGNYKTVTLTKTVSDDYFDKIASGCYYIFNNETFLQVNDVNQQGFFIQGKVKLSDGKYYDMSFVMRRNTNVSMTNNVDHFLGDASLLPSNPGTTDPGTPTDPETPGDPQTPSNPNTSVSTTDSFIPKGFGIRRLGIADYLKVEQSTHAYIEGEVANIENIMAREYREKSTRRLRRSEVTETTSSDTEREQLTDTTTASRFEMQSEVVKILQESTDIGVSANTSFSYGNDKVGRFGLNVGASYANHRSKEDSMRQAVTQAQDITARALDRVVTKVHQERIEKIIEEFEENNSHGFDNRKGDKHVVGVYRWVDKLMKNQVWNYGKRLMFEFAVPQPAKLHLLAMNSREKIVAPVDPRKENGIYNLSNYSKVTDETIKYWSSIFNFQLEDKLEENCSVTKSFNASGDSSEFASKSDIIEIPENYTTTKGKVIASHFFSPNRYEWTHIGITVGDYHVIVGQNASHININEEITFKRGFTKQVGVSIESADTAQVIYSVSLDCVLTPEYKKQWQQKTFNAIIDAYEDAMIEYNNKMAEEENKANNIKGSNPLFYRQIEQEVLKHNCIAYLTVDKSKTKNIGMKMYTGDQLLDFKVDRTDIDDYASFAKFMEQAFEWDIMSYNLYPYYWGNKTEWGSMYVSEDADPLFRSFLRSGMARVVVTVRPGFEDAVQFYMATGRLWNGGEVPVIGDPMYLSIVDELKDIKGETQGKSWITRIPTSLTILQAQNIGLEVQHALPFTTEDPLDFENPEELITKSNFKASDAQMEAEKSKLVENIEINNDYLQLTNNDNPHQVIAQLSLEDLKEALE